jgi:hypothetical protein
MIGLSAASAQDTVVDQAIDAVLGDHTKYEAVILDLQKSVDEHDPASVAALVSYPISVTVDGKRKPIRKVKDFIASYDEIMTAEITAAVVNQRYSNLVVSRHGVAFGSGQVWIRGICRDKRCRNFDVKVIAIQSAE